MNSINDIAISFLKKTKYTAQSIWVSYPKKIQCNICKWEGRHFLSDIWHKHIYCPRCRLNIRQRLFYAAFQYIEDLSFDKTIHGKNILHFAPEEIIRSDIQRKSKYYATADLLRQDCDFKLDMSNMPEIKNESFDVVIAFDVLEHVPDYQKALKEIHRILSLNGYGIFTVPQKDHLSTTYEDPAIVAPQERTKHFGQWDHLRIFGDDFSRIIESKGFAVTSVDENNFSEDIKKRHVLKPPMLSKHPLATNFRKVFFCQKSA